MGRLEIDRKTFLFPELFVKLLKLFRGFDQVIGAATLVRRRSLGVGSCSGSFATRLYVHPEGKQLALDRHGAVDRLRQRDLRHSRRTLDNGLFPNLICEATKAPLLEQFE